MKGLLLQVFIIVIHHNLKILRCHFGYCCYCCCCFLMFFFRFCFIFRPLSGLFSVGGGGVKYYLSTFCLLLHVYLDMVLLHLPCVFAPPFFYQTDRYKRVTKANTIIFCKQDPQLNRVPSKIP